MFGRVGEMVLIVSENMVEDIHAAWRKMTVGLVVSSFGTQVQYSLDGVGVAIGIVEFCNLIVVVVYRV